MNKMKKYLIIILILIIIIFLFFSKFNSSQSDLEPSVTINGEVIKVELADTMPKQTQGLSGRNYMAGNEGMLFVFNDKQIRNFWMKNMNFPIDIIWVEDDNIVKIDKNLPIAGEQPTVSYNSGQPVNYVLEVNAGYSDKNKIKAGDTIILNINQ